MEYRTKQLTSCVNSLYDLLVKRAGHELDSVLQTEYYKNLIFPFCPQLQSTDFSPYCNLNKRMGENLDWQCNVGTILDCLQQLYVDFTKVNGRQEITFLHESLFNYEEILTKITLCFLLCRPLSTVTMHSTHAFFHKLCYIPYMELNVLVIRLLVIYKHNHSMLRKQRI